MPTLGSEINVSAKCAALKKEHAFSNRSEWNISDLDIEEEKESQQLVLIGGSLNDLFLFFQLNRKLGKSLQVCITYVW